MTASVRMQRLAFPFGLAALVTGATAAAPLAAEQSAAPKSPVTSAASTPASPPPVTVSVSATGLHYFAADLSGGGDVEMSRALVSASVSRQFVPAFTAALNLGFDYQDWRFGSPAAFGGQAPWQELRQQAVSLRLRLWGEEC
jgi:hypothetical protein